VTVQISKTYRQAEMIDALENALELEVEAGNFFGTGILPGMVSGTALVPAEWHMESDSRG
jgi:hypothetical protein